MITYPQNFPLEQIGWTEEWFGKFSEYTENLKKNEPGQGPGLRTNHGSGSNAGEPRPGRVIGLHHDIFEIQTASGPRTCTPAGSFRLKAEVWPVVGDWVVVVPADRDTGVVTGLLPRTSALSRGAAGESSGAQVLAANIDYVCIVSGLDHDFNPRRIERYLTIAWNSGAVPILVLNKADLVDDPASFLEEAEVAAPGVDLLMVSALEQSGTDELKAFLEGGATAVLVGSSGSGKSTLTNVLLGESAQETNEVRTGDQRGRHTTTDRRLFLVPGGGVVIDTPGLREVGVLGDESGLDAGFPEIARLAEECRFADCSHEHEPGCAVLAALETREINRERYEAYLKQRKELAYTEDRQEALRRKEEWHKSVSKEIRRFYKNRR